MNAYYNGLITNEGGGRMTLWLEDLVLGGKITKSPLTRWTCRSTRNSPVRKFSLFHSFPLCPQSWRRWQLKRQRRCFWFPPRVDIKSIVSSIEGSLQSCAMITPEYDGALCSTGFYILASALINSETLLVLFKSEPIQALIRDAGVENFSLCQGVSTEAVMGSVRR